MSACNHNNKPRKPTVLPWTINIKPLTSEANLLNGLYLCDTRWLQKKGAGVAAGTGSCYRLFSTLEGGNPLLTSAWLNGPSRCQRCSKKRSWNNKACACNDTLHKKNAGKRSEAKGHNVCVCVCVCLWAFAVQMAALRNLNLSRQDRRGDMSASFFSSGTFFQAAPLMLHMLLRMQDHWDKTDEQHFFHFRWIVLMSLLREFRQLLW